MAQAKTLMSLLEEVSERSYNAYFVDLFVRVSNALAISMYKRFGYSVYRRVLGYYSGEEDAFGMCLVGFRRCVYLYHVCTYSCGAAFNATPLKTDMRKALVRDRDRKSVIPMTRPITPNELEW